MANAEPRIEVCMDTDLGRRVKQTNLDRRFDHCVHELLHLSALRHLTLLRNRETQVFCFRSRLPSQRRPIQTSCLSFDSSEHLVLASQSFHTNIEEALANAGRPHRDAPERAPQSASNSVLLASICSQKWRYPSDFSLPAGHVSPQPAVTPFGVDPGGLQHRVPQVACDIIE